MKKKKPAPKSVRRRVKATKALTGSPAPSEVVPDLWEEIEREKQASRDADARDLASGRITREQLHEKNSLFKGKRWSVDLKSAKRLW